MSYQTAHRFCKLLLFLALPLVLLSGFLSRYAAGVVCFFLAIASAAAGLLIALLFYRCPQCRHLLIDGKPQIPDKCPQCGASLKCTQSDYRHD